MLSVPELLAPLMKMSKKRLYKINNTYIKLYFKLKHVGKLDTYILIQLFNFFFYSY